VEITQQGDVGALWKTEATTCRGSDRLLPDPEIACCGGGGAERKYQAQNARSHISSRWRLTAMEQGITLKGELQLDRLKFVRWLYGNDGHPSRRDWALFGYTGLLVAVTGVLVSALALRGWSGAGPTPTWPLAALALAAIVAERQSVSISSRTEISVSFLPVVLAAVIYGALGAVVVSATSLILDFGRPHARWIVWTCSRSLAAVAAGMAASLVDGPSGNHSLARVVAAVAAATVVDQVSDLVFGCITATLRGMSYREILRAANTISFAIPLYTPVSALLVYAYREVSPWSVVLFLFPAFVAQKLFLLYQEQRATSEELASAVERQERAHLSFASALVATLDARDRYTAGHSAVVAIYAQDIANRLGLSEEERRLAHLCGLVHDIGKVGLPAGLLEKPGPLTLDERRQMEQHPVIGERILARVEDYAEIAGVVRHHHERVDGGGYPDGLVGEDIPILSRIIAVADAYNAMTSHRPYREAMPSRVARMRMAQAVETQFDTAVVAAFEAILAGATEAYRTGHQNDSALYAERETILRSDPILALAR
jgi:putative nucleotidyltransferase with HDIG domain